jgi:hypothetical protein
MKGSRVTRAIASKLILGSVNSWTGSSMQVSDSSFRTGGGRMDGPAGVMPTWVFPSRDELKARRLAIRPNETGAPDGVGAVAFPDSEVEGAW